MGTIEPVKAFSEAFDPAFRLVWADESNGAASPAAADIMEKVTRDFTDAQRRQVIRVDDANAVAQQVSTCVTLNKGSILTLPPVPTKLPAI